MEIGRRQLFGSFVVVGDQDVILFSVIGVYDWDRGQGRDFTT
jgi:hypothetical protein